MDEIQKRLTAFGCELPADFSGKWIAFDRNGKSQVGRMKGRVFKGPRGEVRTLYVQDWSTGEKIYLRSDDSVTDYTPEELAALKHEETVREAREREEKEARQNEAAEKARELWASATPFVKEHPYTTAKGLSPHSIYVREYRGCLLIPIYNRTGLRSLQYLLPEKNAQGRNKDFLAGGQKKGCYGIADAAGERAFQDTLYVAEGWATATSVSMAVEQPVLIAFDSGNLPNLAREFPFKCSRVVICADNDQWTPGNPGLTKAGEAAEILRAKGMQVRVIAPSFDTDARGKTDWDDWRQGQGLASMKLLLANGEPSPDSEHTSISEPGGFFDLFADDLPQVPCKGLKPPQETVASALAEYLDDRVTRTGDDLFFWIDGKYWAHQDVKEAKHKLRRVIQRIAIGRGDNKFLNETYQMFLSMVEPAKHNMFAPNPFATTFLDGTAWVNPKTFEVTFEAHKKSDYLTRCLPFNWNEKRPYNEMLLKYLDRVFEGSGDKEQKIRALQQMAGACLIPCFPHVFFLYGPPGSSKSTIAKLCGLMVTPQYRSRQQLRDMGTRFGLQPMINKLVNIHTELSEVMIDDSVVKLIEDREPVNVDRKGIASVDAYIPAVHIFCCNKMPRSRDGDTGAYTRRVTLLEFQNQLKEVQENKHTRDFERFIFDSDPAGVFTWARDGLLDLVREKGIYLVPDSGVQAATKWGKESDQFSQFLDALDAGEIGTPGCEIMRSEKGWLQAKILKEAYLDWAQKTRMTHPISRNKLYERLRQEGFSDELNRDKILYFKGLKVRGTPDVPANRENTGENTGASSIGF